MPRPKLRLRRMRTLTPSTETVSRSMVPARMRMPTPPLALGTCAAPMDLETVSVLGVNVRILRNLNFGLGIYLAGLAGVLAAGMLGLQPTIGASLIMPS